MDNRDLHTGIVKFMTAVMWLVISAVLLTIVLIVVCDVASAESAVVSFNDAEQLAAISDSITDVCDTVEGYWVHEDTIYNFKIYVPEIEDSVAFDYAYVDSDSTDEYPYWADRTITCRELDSVRVEIHVKTVIDTLAVSYDGFFDDLFPTKKIPGEAIIFYRKVK